MVYHKGEEEASESFAPQSSVFNMFLETQEKRQPSKELLVHRGEGEQCGHRCCGTSKTSAILRLGIYDWSME